MAVTDSPNDSETVTESETRDVVAEPTPDMVESLTDSGLAVILSRKVAYTTRSALFTVDAYSLRDRIPSPTPETETVTVRLPVGDWVAVVEALMTEAERKADSGAYASARYRLSEAYSLAETLDVEAGGLYNLKMDVVDLGENDLNVWDSEGRPNDPEA